VRNERRVCEEHVYSDDILLEATMSSDGHFLLVIFVGAGDFNIVLLRSQMFAIRRAHSS
jgi:hypothetical protein